MSRPRPYVGVSGVVSAEQKRWIREAARPIVEDKGRVILLGVKAVHKTHWREMTNKYGRDHYPVGHNIAGALGTLSPGEMGVAQVFMDIAEARKDGIDRYNERFVKKLLGYNAAWLTGIQFDRLPWDRYDYTKFLTTVKDEIPTTILQCHGAIMDRLSPQEIVERLKRYEGLFDYVLFDGSEGRGIPMNPDKLEPYVDAAYSLAHIGVGVAGGLDQVTVISKLQTLLNTYPNLSFDAEGGLRPGKRGALDIGKTQQYLHVAAQVIDPVNKQLTLEHWREANEVES